MDPRPGASAPGLRTPSQAPPPSELGKGRGLGRTCAQTRHTVRFMYEPYCVPMRASHGSESG
eukprot:4302422-Alexandrium_andersonii.AAC.1